MASEQDVKQYLAYWLQLGKKVKTGKGTETLLPQAVFQGSSYSEEFESCWQYILSPESGECHLEGTEQSIKELLTASWDVNSCSRCEMPVPVKKLGMQPLFCPCIDLENWPNTELPAPRSPVNSQEHLSKIRNRLLNSSNQK